MRTFLAVLEEGAVTKAAGKMRVTQSAVSHTLDKLRLFFEDPLFIRDGRGITPSARALSLREPIEDLLRGIEALPHQGEFDPLRHPVEFTIATNQVDFAVPAKFGLQYKDRDNTMKTPLCIHRAPLGTHERFIGFLIEHYAGNFPLWLAPEQVRVLTIGEDDALVDYAKAIVSELRAHEVRVEADFSHDPIKAKVADAEKARVHTMLAIGPRDMEHGNVSIRLHGKGHQGAKPRAEAVTGILSAIQDRRA